MFKVKMVLGLTNCVLCCVFVWRLVHCFDIIGFIAEEKAANSLFHHLKCWRRSLDSSYKQRTAWMSRSRLLFRQDIYFKTSSNAFFHLLVQSPIETGVHTSDTLFFTMNQPRYKACKVLQNSQYKACARVCVHATVLE